MYGFKIPVIYSETTILGKEVKVECQTFHAYESIFLEDYKKIYKKYPDLNYNCDPNYK